MAVVIKQIVVGISNDTQDRKNIDLFDCIGNTMWKMLETRTGITGGGGEEKKGQTGNVISIVKILGILSPLILRINGMVDLKKFFNKLL